MSDKRDTFGTSLLPFGNCPYCDSERGVDTAWGMSPIGWARMKEEHDKGHPKFSSAGAGLCNPLSSGRGEANRKASQSVPADQSIIGIAKKLHEAKCVCKSFPLNDSQYVKCAPCRQIEELFPLFAQALLIAVEALESISLGHDMSTYVDSTGATVDTHIAREALSRIRSLPLPK